MVYKKSYEAAKTMYKLVNSVKPREEMFGLTSQIKRASTSIPLNIAEGYAKNSGKAETIRFLQMAIGSTAEMSVLINMIYDFGYITQEPYRMQTETYDEIGKMITGLIKSIKEKREN
jgi:four helix bundle protein